MHSFAEAHQLISRMQITSNLQRVAQPPFSTYTKRLHVGFVVLRSLPKENTHRAVVPLVFPAGGSGPLCGAELYAQTRLCLRLPRMFSLRLVPDRPWYGDMDCPEQCAVTGDRSSCHALLGTTLRFYVYRTGRVGQLWEARGLPMSDFLEQ